uniref:Si:dkeyp-77h1.4 n=1 Tax=Myripristis murdjan TaxID=586833 RepID=A0A667Z2T0_9TELE
ILNHQLLLFFCLPSSFFSLPDVVLMRGGKVIGSRAKLNHLSHLILESVKEKDEGTYTVTNPEKPDDIRITTLIVRDCTNEQNIKYGDNFHIQLFGVITPITLEFRTSAAEANETHRPGLVLLTSAGVPTGGYEGRISITERHVTLSAVTGADEGSYTVSDTKGKIERKVCLNVKGHQNFVQVPYGGRLKVNLILNSSLVQLYYSRNNDNIQRLLMDKGELISVSLGFEERLSVEGSVVILDQVKSADAGQFKITDMQGFTVSNVYLEVQPYRLPPVYVAVIALLGLLVFLLLVCLLSCLIKVKKRAKRAAALEKLAQNAGKEDEGDAFRQVVKNITKLNEESKHSQADTTEKSQSTEVDIKGLEVSSKEVGVGNLETSDSGVGFNTTALPLDTDTDAPDHIPDSEAVSISIAPETQPSQPAAAEVKPSAPPAIEIKPSPVTPETKKTPDQPAEVKLDVLMPAEDKLSPAQSPESKLVSKPSPSDGLDTKTSEPKPAPSPSPEPKTSSPKAPTPPAESKSALTPTPEPPKPTTPEPITNGTPEPAPESNLSPDPADLIGGSAPKVAPTKTPEVELNSSSPILEASKDGAMAEDSTTTT